MAKVKRKMWVMCLLGLGFDGIVSAAKNHKLEVLKAFKPDMMVDVHLGVKGEKEDIEKFKNHLIKKGNQVRNRCPRRAFQFTI